MVIVAIDGASKRNGQPNCLGVGAAFLKYNEDISYVTTFEKNSTNQRAELLALIEGLKEALKFDKEVMLITDSEYIYKALNNDWISNWKNKGWITSTKEPVKNRDLWEKVGDLLAEINDLVVYHVKGHIFSFGRVTAAQLIENDNTGKRLFRAVHMAVLEKLNNKENQINKALDLFERNHGYKPPLNIFIDMLIYNTIADVIASYAADKYEAAVNLS